MPRLSKLKYTTAKGERKISCYLMEIPKKAVAEARFDDDDELVAYAYHGEIRIALKYICTCMECDHEWESGQQYNSQTMCPRCHCGDIDYRLNGE